MIHLHRSSEREHLPMSIKELAAYFGCSADYIYRMKIWTREPLPLVAGKASPAEIRAWLQRNPDYRSAKARISRTTVEVRFDR